MRLLQFGFEVIQPSFEHRAVGTGLDQLASVIFELSREIANKR